MLNICIGNVACSQIIIKFDRLMKIGNTRVPGFESFQNIYGKIKCEFKIFVKWEKTIEITSQNNKNYNLKKL